MAKRKHPDASVRIKPDEDNFVPDLNTGSSIDDAMTGFDQPPAPSPIIDQLNTTPSFAEGQSPDASVRVKRKYTKRNQAVDPDEPPLIDGEMIQMFIDVVVPMAIAGVHNMVSQEKISPDVIEATTKQQEKMKKLADKMAAQWNVNMPPWLGLTIVAGVAYGGAYIKNKP